MRFCPHVGEVVANFNLSGAFQAGSSGTTAGLRADRHI